MKTPEEIKKGLENCNIEGKCSDCPYDDSEDYWSCCVRRNADAIAYIQQLEAQTQKWISVEEKLPKEAEDVLVFCRNDTITWVVIAHHVGRQWWRVGVPIECVTHWMPRPEPPKVE